MKQLFYAIVPAIALMSVTSSCQKETPTTPQPQQPQQTTPTPAMTQPTQVNGDKVYGALISVEMNYMISQAGITVPFSAEVGAAAFYSAPGNGTLVDAGTVSVNSVQLEKNNNYYVKTASVGLTPSDLDFTSGTSAWSVGGSGSVPGFSYSHAGSFPSYSTALPTSVSKGSGMTLTFNSGNTSGADSVYVVIASGSNSITKAFAANAGTVTISSGDLSGLATVSDNTAMLQINPVKVNVANIGGRLYALVKEQANIAMINVTP